MAFGKNVEHFLVWFSSNLSKQKRPTAEITGLYYIEIIGTLRLVASANSTTIVELIGELFIGEILNYNFSDSQKACFN